MKQLGKKILSSLVVLVVLVLVFEPMVRVDAAYIKEQFSVSEGITYKDYRLSDNRYNQAVRVMGIYLPNKYAHIDVGVPVALNALERTTSQARRHTTQGHAVVGAINASFFHLGTAMNLVSKDNRLIHAGEIFPGSDKYVNQPIAFGVNSSGKGIIDYYNIDMTYTHNGSTYEISSTNKIRYENETILYTSDYTSSYTDTNQYGREIVVTLPSKPSYEFGSTVTGQVSKVRAFGDQTKTEIPKNGFVISGIGKGRDDLENIKVGDSITLSVDVDSKWKNSQFMLASGPLLVKNGKVSMTMDPNSANARTRAPRTAVAISKNGDRVYYVTVDGRQSGYSNGMSLREFANYLVDLGVDTALNLDGGGSTTMAVRYPGKQYATLANSPSDGYERAVSTTLLAISTAPPSTFSDVRHDFWAYTQIESLVGNGTISGYPDGTFRPNLSISRSHAAVLLVNELNLDTENVTNPGFRDVKTSDKYYKFIAAAANAGLLEGKGNNKFDKDAQLTRAEMAVLLQKAFEIPSADKSYFPDVKSSHWGYDYINALAANDLAGGYTDGTYRPDRPVTRAEFTTFIYRANKQ
ncbi:S-layer homology domain-containing protein [Gracilibacillus xinjiangensis]|uniref:S-layer homology domain-containing protein n=1 Tax=Gracilibacillus xinjiangensis TaxID=1193282 RepID=A0ABV8WUL9_9BACI